MTNFSRISQAPVMVVYDLTLNAPYVRTSQAPQLAVVDEYSELQTSQTPVLVVYHEGPIEDFRLRAWSFVLDGHVMYALSLGNLGTIVHDLSTQQWSQFDTVGYEPMWNAQNGLMWQGMIIACDMANGTLWQVDPDAELDEGARPIERSAVALIAARGRGLMSVGALTVNASAGRPVGDAPLVNLRFSDNDGRSWTSMEPVTMETRSGSEPSQLLAWRSLGSFGQPGRIFEISDNGAMVRLSDIDMVLEGEESA